MQLQPVYREEKQALRFQCDDIARKGGLGLIAEAPFSWVLLASPHPAWIWRVCSAPCGIWARADTLAG